MGFELSPQDWQAIGLTLRVSTLTTLILLVLGTPRRLVAGAHPFGLEGAGDGRGGHAHRAAADRDRLLPAGADGAQRAGRGADPGAGHRHPAVHVLGADRGVGVLLAAVHGAADPQRAGSDGDTPARSRCHAARRALGPVLPRGGAARRGPGSSPAWS